MFYLVKWPYKDCRIFNFGNLVLYKLEDNGLYYWHPDLCWKLASRKNILQEAEIIKQSESLSDLRGYNV